MTRFRVLVAAGVCVLAAGGVVAEIAQDGKLQFKRMEPLSLSSQARSHEYRIQTDFEHVFGGKGEETGNSILALEDGGYLVVGYTTSFGSGNRDVYLVRTDGDGNEVWSVTFGGKGDDWAWEAVPAGDGDFIVTGFGNSEGAGADDILALRVDADGDLIWKKTYGYPRDEKSWGITRTSDGLYAICGQAENESTGFDVYLIGIDGEGRKRWERETGGAGVDRVFSMATMEEGDLVFAGMSSTESHGGLDVYVIRTSPTGEVVWERRFGEKRDDIGHGVIVLPDGRIMVTGYAQSPSDPNNIIVMTISPDGRELHKTTFGTIADDRAMMSAATEDGFLTVGYTQMRGDLDAYLIRWNEEGTTFGHWIIERDGFDRGVFVRTIAPDAFVFTGSFGGPTPAKAGMPFVRMKTSLPEE